MIRILTFIFCLLPAFVLADDVRADEVTLSGDFVQGGLIMGQIDQPATIFLDDKEIQPSKSGRFVFGFGRDFKETAILTVRFEDGRRMIRDLEIAQRTYKTEKVDGLPPSKVTPSEKFLKRIRKENGEIARIRTLDTREEWFQSGWQWPAIGRISGVFGSQRILNGIPKRPHFGLDVAAPVGTPVFASTDGKVRMAEKDLYYTGGTVMIDHGHGLVSVYSHLSKLDVSSGDDIIQGTKIGEIGDTGRASGPHLDWRLNWFNQRLDPQLLLGNMPFK